MFLLDVRQVQTQRQQNIMFMSVHMQEKLVQQHAITLSLVDLLEVVTVMEIIISMVDIILED